MIHFQPEEFIVEEMLESGEVLEIDKPFQRQSEALKSANSYFSVFVLQKRLWTTNNAIRQVADRLHIGSNRMNFGGNKDRNAITTQLCSAFAVPPEKLLALSIRDIKINGAWLSNEKVKLGALAGNRFTITLTKNNAGEKEFEKLSAKKIIAKMKKKNFAITNYFGEQRFGSARKNTARVGRLLMEGKFKEAVMDYLVYTDEGERDEGARMARKKLASDMNFQEALRYFPHFLKTEKLMIAHLSANPADFLGAFRRLHRSMQLLFIHAFQSELFNQIVGEKEKKKAISKPIVGGRYCLLKANGFPEDEKPIKIGNKEEAKKVAKLIGKGEGTLLGNIIGHLTELEKGEEKLLKAQKIKKEDFMIKGIPELSSKGTLRPMFVFLKNFDAQEIEVNGEKKIVLKFDLPSGSYATVAMDQIIK